MKNKRRPFKSLTEEDQEYLRHIFHSKRTHKEKTDILSSKFGIGERTVRLWWASLELTSKDTDLVPQLQAAQKRALKKGTKVLLVTTAQNKTSINSDFLASMEQYREFIENTLGKQAEIVVIPARYRNPTSNVEKEKVKARDWWEDAVQPYLFYGKVDFGDTVVSADSRISPTAKDPLLGYEILANNKHVVLGHSKIHFKTLPRLKKDSLRTMCTTGYVTVKNYSNSKAGEVAYENHSYGFVILELKPDGTCYIPRNVKVTKEGTFIDIVHSVTPNGVTRIEKTLGFVWGDIHTRMLDRKVVEVTKDLLLKLKPEKSVTHDVLDGSSFNPHEVKDMFIQRRKIMEGKHLIEEEIGEVMDFLKEIQEYSGDLYVVESNHDVFLDRHINSENWKRDLHNSPAYLQYAYIQQTVDLREHGNILGYLIDQKFKDEVKYLKMGDSFKIADYECALHGDFGTNGAKGNVKGFGRLNVKLITAHTHSPAIFNNTTCVGLSSFLSQYYNRKGFSSWAIAHSVIHENKKNQLLTFGDDYSLSGLI
jgi:hypothetical protein